MRLYNPTTFLALATLLFFLATFALTSPTGQYLAAKEKQTHSTFNTTSMHQRDSTSLFAAQTVASPNGDGNHIIVTLEPGVNFETCAPNKKMPTMCTLAYVEKSTWGGWGEFWVYDNECNWLGANDHVARNWLAARWSLASKLRWFVDIRITNARTEKKTKGVEIWYGNHYLEPFYRPLFKYSAYVYLAQFLIDLVNSNTFLAETKTPSIHKLRQLLVDASCTSETFLLTHDQEALAEHDHYIVKRRAPISISGDGGSGNPEPVFYQSQIGGFFLACKLNLGDQHMCSFALLEDSGRKGGVSVDIFGHKCNWIRNEAPAREKLKTIKSFTTSLRPKLLDVHMDLGYPQAGIPSHLSIGNGKE
ncbi:hypothetical protein ACEPPN_004098 [Leptodophora sp. 'Broadleaf-Isolate-01']